MHATHVPYGARDRGWQQFQGMHASLESHPTRRTYYASISYLDQLVFGELYPRVSKHIDRGMFEWILRVVLGVYAALVTDL